MGYTPKEQLWTAKHYRMHCRFAADHYQGTITKPDMLHPLCQPRLAAEDVPSTRQMHVPRQGLMQTSDTHHTSSPVLTVNINELMNELHITTYIKTAHIINGYYRDTLGSYPTPQHDWLVLAASLSSDPSPTRPRTYH